MMPIRHTPTRPVEWTKRDFLKALVATAGAFSLGVPAGVAAAESPRARRGRLGVRPSPWFRPLSGQRLQCTLCPKACRIDPGGRGQCRVRENRAGQGYTLVYGTPVILQVDPIERKPFFHVLPGSPSLSVATAGCPLACKFCQAWDLALVAPEDVHAFEVPPVELVRHARETGARSVAFTFGEPVACFEYMLDTLREARRAGLRTLLHSSGYIQPEPLDALMDGLDGANIDLKGFDETFYRELCGGELAPVLSTLQRLKSAGVHLEITALLIPTLNDRPDRLRAMCRWIHDELGPQTPVHFSRFYPLYQLSNLPPTPVSTLDTARSIARDAGLEYTYVSNVPGHESEKTRCPGCGAMLVDRLGFMVESVNIAAGRCVECGRPVPGLWADEPDGADSPPVAMQAAL